MQEKGDIISWLERNLPKISVGIYTIISILFRFNFYLLKGYEQLFANAITFTSILIGVLMSMIGFVLGFSNKEVIDRVKNQGVSTVLIKYFIKPIVAGIAIVILSLILGAIIKQDCKLNETIYVLLTALWGALAIYFIVSTLRILILMYLILMEAFAENSEKKTSKSFESPNSSQEESINVSFDDRNDIFS